jgi:hypothetical protein
VISPGSHHVPNLPEAASMDPSARLNDLAFAPKQRDDGTRPDCCTPAFYMIAIGC